MAGRQKKGGRYTPPANAARAPRPPAGESEPTPEVGRRPTPPVMLFILAGMWIVAGVVAGIRLDVSWRLIPAVVFIGIGLLYLRAAITTVVRRDEHAARDRD
jgi:hypothetical protein